MASTNLQIGGNNGDGEMVLLAQSGGGQWRELGASADPVDGRNELNLLLEEATTNLSAIYRWQALAASKLKDNEYMTNPVRQLGSLAISRNALRILRHIASAKDVSSLSIAEKNVSEKLAQFGEPSTGVIPPSAKGLYEHISRKYTNQWKDISNGILAWASGACEAGMEVISKLYGIPKDTILGCAADLSALTKKGAIRRETLGRLVVGCKNGQCTKVNIKPSIVQELIQSFRNLFFGKTGRPAGIVHGGSDKLPIIDLGYFTKERADMLTCTEADDDIPIVHDTVYDKVNDDNEREL
jgi:hypothetical protein